MYYDLYNNGLYNRFNEVRTVLRITPLHYGIYPGCSSEILFQKDFIKAVESKIDEIVLLAAQEQQIIVVELSAHEKIQCLRTLEIRKAIVKKSKKL